MEITKTITKVMYRIEPKPGGGFIARADTDQSSGQAMEPIEAATQEELQQKIEAKMTELIQQQMPTIFKLGGIDVAVNRKVNITTQSASGKTITSRQEALPPGSDLVNLSAPIVPSTTGGTMLRVLAVLIVLILVYAFFLAHR